MAKDPKDCTRHRVITSDDADYHLHKREHEREQHDLDEYERYQRTLQATPEHWSQLCDELTVRFNVGYHAMLTVSGEINN